MSTRIYHWKHGWIPLDHVAALSKAHGSSTGASRALARSHASGHAHESVISGTYAGGTHVRGLQPVAAEHLARHPHVVAAFHPQQRRFSVLDQHAGTMASVSEPLAEHFNLNGERITSVTDTAHGPRITVTRHDGSVRHYVADPEQLAHAHLEHEDTVVLEAATADLMRRGDFESPLFKKLTAEIDRRDAPDPAHNPFIGNVRDLTHRGAIKRRDPEAVLRGEFDTWVHTQWLRAEDETRGHLLTPAGERAFQRGEFDVRDLFTRKRTSLEFASEELRRWFAEPGNQRMSFPEFRAGLMSDKKARQASSRRRNRGYESEYG